jgi:hypothetical protein
MRAVLLLLFGALWAKPPSLPASKPNKWNIYHIKGTPAVLLGQVEAPDVAREASFVSSG